MRKYLASLNRKTKALLSILLFQIPLAQWSWASGWVAAHLIPKLAHHPRIAAVVTVVLAVGLLLHKPGPQKFLHDIMDRHPDIPIQPGAKMGSVEVVAKPE